MSIGSSAGADTHRDAVSPVVAPCDCMETTNAMLREKHNTILAFTFGTPSRTVLQTMKFDEKKRGKPVAMIASYCPFCGQGYSAKAVSS